MSTTVSPFGNMTICGECLVPRPFPGWGIAIIVIGIVLVLIIIGIVIICAVIAKKNKECCGRSSKGVERYIYKSACDLNYKIIYFIKSVQLVL